MDLMEKLSEGSGSAKPQVSFWVENKEIVRAVSLPDVRQRLSAEGAELVGNSPREFDVFIRNELAKWAKVVKLSGAKAE